MTPEQLLGLHGAGGAKTPSDDPRRGDMHQQPAALLAGGPSRDGKGQAARPQTASPITHSLFTASELQRVPSRGGGLNAVGAKPSNSPRGSSLLDRTKSRGANEEMGFYQAGHMRGFLASSRSGLRHLQDGHVADGADTRPKSASTVGWKALQRAPPTAALGTVENLANLPEDEKRERDFLHNPQQANGTSPEQPSNPAPDDASCITGEKPPRPPAPVSASRPSTSMSGYSVVAMALGKCGMGHGMERHSRGSMNGGGSRSFKVDRDAMRRRGGTNSRISRAEMALVSPGRGEECDDIDSIDLALMRIRHEGVDGGGVGGSFRDDCSIDIVNNGSNDDDGILSLLSFEMSCQGTANVPPAASVMPFVGKAYVADGIKAVQEQIAPLPQKSSNNGILSEGHSGIKIGGLGDMAMAVQPAGRRGTLAASLRQAAPMVLNLEDLTGSTPEVLELELGRMSLGELMRLDQEVSRKHN